MVRITSLALLAVMAISMVTAPMLPACSIFSVARESGVWFASNEDWPLTGFDIWTEPAGDGKYGQLYIGFAGEVPACGINEQGLCFDLASVAGKFPPLDSHKRTSDRFVLMKLLEQCSSVPEALDTLAFYNIEFLSQSQILLADRFGNSAVVESDSLIVRKGEGLQVITNFRYSEAAGGPAPCERYRAIEQVLGSGPATLENVRAALAASHQECGSATQYSVAYDMVQGKLYIWFFHNFADAVQLDLKAEIVKAPYCRPLVELFPNPVVAYGVFADEHKRPDYQPVSLENTYLDSLTGSYAIAPGYNLEISRLGEKVYCRMFGMAPYQIVPASTSKFYFQSLPAEVEFDLSQDSLRIVYPFGKIPAGRIH